MPVKTADELRHASIFELSDEELRERLRPAAEAVQRETFAKGGYLTYYDRSVCPDNSYMVHEYLDKKELVKLDGNGKSHLVKRL